MLSKVANIMYDDHPRAFISLPLHGSLSCAHRLNTHLDNLVPSSRHNDGVARVGAEANAGDPLAVTVLLNVELALSKSVPQLNGAVTASTNDLTVVSAEADRENVTGMADEPSCGLTGVQVPQTQGLVPRSRESELAVARHSHVADEVVVAV